MMTHDLIRTSPKGSKFVGRCIKCGKRNLEAKAAKEQCDVKTTDSHIKKILNGKSTKTEEDGP